MKPETNEERLSEELTGLALDTVREVRNNKRWIPFVLGAVFFVACIFFVTSVFPLIRMATTMGQATGENSGHVAGVAVGSVEGATQAVQAGYAEGEEEGLSAKDTVVKVAGVIDSNVNSLGRLEVLVANVDLTTYHEVGKKYGALFLTRGSAVFTIDLSRVAVTYNDETISIVLPKPEVEIKIDPSETKLLAERQQKFFNGTDGEGYQAALNTFKAMKNVSESEVANYSALMEMASSSAVAQIETIAYAARGDTKIGITVSVQSN